MEQTQDMMPMVSVTRLTNAKGESGGIVAFADVVIGRHFGVRGIRIMRTATGEWVSMPGYKAKSGKYEETFFPVTREGKELLHSQVKAAYKIGRGGKAAA